MSEELFVFWGHESLKCSCCITQTKTHDWVRKHVRWCYESRYFLGFWGFMALASTTLLDRIDQSNCCTYLMNTVLDIMQSTVIRLCHSVYLVIICTSCRLTFFSEQTGCREVLIKHLLNFLIRYLQPLFRDSVESLMNWLCITNVNIKFHELCFWRQESQQTSGCTYSTCVM